MTLAFPADRILPLAMLLAAAALPAGAQEAATGSPLQLTPDGAPPALEAPPPVLPGGPAAPPEFEAEGVSGIEIGELRELDPDSGGILDSSLGGLGVDMWAGADRSRLLRLLPQLPAFYRSPALHDLGRRLLLSSAIAPARGPDDPGTSLIGLRIERLAAMGLTGAVAEMMAIAPPPETDATLLRLHLDNRLLLDDTEGACGAFAAAQVTLEAPLGDQLRVFCDALADNKEAAGITANLLREGGEIDDPAFFALADALTAGLRANVKSLADPQPIHLAMAMAAEVKLPSDVLETESPIMLRALADSPLVSDSVRLAAAERAALAGALAPVDLAGRYVALEFSRKELDNAISIAEGEPSPRNRALLYQAAKQQDLPVARAAAMQKAWALAAADGSYRLSIAVYQGELEALQPSAELLWFAADATRALFLLNQQERALAWAATAQRHAQEAEEKQAAMRLWPLVALAEGSSTGQAHERWLSAIAEAGPADAAMKAGYAYSLFEAMGERMAEGRWEALLDGGGTATATAPDLAYLRAFRMAASAGRRGETALLAILTLGGDLGDYGPGLLSEIVIGLRKVGLEDEARRLAIEAALAAGL